jgi:hypothetical protein
MRTSPRAARSRPGPVELGSPGLPGPGGQSRPLAWVRNSLEESCERPGHAVPAAPATVYEDAPRYRAAAILQVVFRATGMRLSVLAGIRYDLGNPPRSDIEQRAVRRARSRLVTTLPAL